MIGYQTLYPHQQQDGCSLKSSPFKNSPDDDDALFLCRSPIGEAPQSFGFNFMFDESRAPVHLLSRKALETANRYCYHVKELLTK